MNALDVRNLSKRFGAFKAVDNIGFAIPEGVIFGLPGRNGAGKTTIRKLMNIYEPDGGDIRFRGAREGQDFRDRVGYLPEERGLNTKLRVMDTLLYLAELKGKNGQAVTERAQYYLDRFELGARGNSRIQELSKGNPALRQNVTRVLNEALNRQYFADHVAQADIDYAVKPLAINAAILYGAVVAGGKIYRISVLATGQQPTMKQFIAWLRQPA